MKVLLTLGRDCEHDDHQDHISFEPTFLSPKGQCVLGHVEVLSDGGKLLDAFDLIISASTGKVTKKSRSAPVTAFADMTDEERKAMANAQEDDDE